MAATSVLDQFKGFLEEHNCPEALALLKGLSPKQLKTIPDALFESFMANPEQTISRLSQDSCCSGNQP